MFTGCSVPGDYGSALELSLWFCFFRYLAAAQDKVRGCSSSCSNCPGWHNATVVIPAVHAAIPPTALVFACWHTQSSHSFAWDKNKSTLKAEKQSRACKTWSESDQITPYCSSASWASVAGGRTKLFWVRCPTAQLQALRPLGDKYL